MKRPRPHGLGDFTADWRMVPISLLAIGIGVGLALSVALGKTASSLLFGVKPADPVTLGLAAGLLALVAAAACYVPARRASKFDPMTALRYE